MRQRTLRFTAVVAVIVALALAIVLVNPIHLNILGGRLDRTGDGPFGLTLGLDLRGGSHLVYEADVVGVTDDDMDGAVKNVERRINAFGVSEPLVQRLGGDRIVIQLPGVRDIEEAKRLIGKTAQLVVKERTCLDAACVTYEDKEIGLTGDDLASASPSTQPTTGAPIVNMQWNSRGTPIFADLTGRIAGDGNKRIAFILDGQDLLAPVARARIPDGSGYIEGSTQDPFTFEEVRTLAIQLNSGRLPVPLKLIQESTVDAVLGADSLDASMKAGIVGVALVIAFMVAYYRAAGVVASGALFIYALIALSIFKMLPVTMTLSGLAGFILSIGMAVDANVLIFERMKEELRTGRSLTSAAEAGFQRAWTSIRDSNISTFITCAILYWFGTRLGGSLVMGFALTLFIGVAVSMFSAITVSRNLLQLVVMFTPVGKKPAWFTPEPLTRAAKPAAGGS